jgi:hypothetical protein
MNNNIISIDPSLSCTAMVVNEKRFVFANEKLALTSKEELTKWFKLCEPLVEYHFTNYDHLDDYSDNEVNKLSNYDITTQVIMEAIQDNISLTHDTKIFIEGYSYSSAAGPLIDLVTFSTLLRKKLYELTKNIQILSPSQLKLEACKLTYPPIPKGKKVIRYEYKNNDGIAGGSFTKREIYKALTENNNLQDVWTHFLRKHQKDVLNYKNVPKPLEDINDSEILYWIAKNK